MYLIGIAGGSGSGKTTFSKKIITRARELSPFPRSTDVALLHQDSYYHAIPPENPQVHGAPNFDHPDAFDWALLRDQLAELKAGGRVEAPVYDYKSSRRLSETEALGPCQVIIFEGIFTLWDPAVRDLFDVKVYLNVDADIRFIRRLYRDVHQRGRTLDSVIRQYYDTVRPMHHEYLEPTRQFADLVVGEETDIAASILAAKVSERVSRASLTPPHP